MSRLASLSKEGATAIWRRSTPWPEYTVGAEEELMLLDPFTLQPAPAIEAIIAGERNRGPAYRELMQCQVEIRTEPCRTAEQIHSELAAVRADLRRDAALHNVVVAAAGTHPLSLSEDQPITAADRPRELVAALRWAARRTLAFGMHVHVSVADPDKALQIVEAMLGDLPLVLALSGSSPFYAGEETGVASTRTLILQNMPRTGMPPVFESYRDFQTTLGRLTRAGAVRDYTFIWWDVRIQPRLGTVEVRIMDVQPSVADAAAIAGLIQALVRYYGTLYDQGRRFAPTNRLIVNENRWLAARHGLRARLVSAAEDAVGARALLADLLDRVEGDAAELDNEWALERIAEITAEGTSSERQLRMLRGGEPVEGILRALVKETGAS